jgi:hypothetical protein
MVNRESQFTIHAGNLSQAIDDHGQTSVAHRAW